MNRKIAHISLLVDDYDEAIDFYIRKLHFTLVEDIVLGEDKRWVLIAAQGYDSFSLLLAKAQGEDQKSQVENQCGGRVFLFLYTDNFERDYNNLLDHNITIIRDPVKEPYGTVAVFADLYGNKWDLIEPVQK